MTLSDFRPLFDQVIIGNCGYDFESATQAIASGQADMIAFGRPYISNPDLPTRYQHGLPLAAHTDVTHWYGGGAEGYSDYPAYKAE
jgi:N-ethylmaleimide reductase